MNKTHCRKSGMSDKDLDELGRRLAAAYVSYIVGHKGIDRMLKQAPGKPGEFWVGLADLLFAAAKAGGSVDSLRIHEVITNYIQ
jgi:hypothetical protein